MKSRILMTLLISALCVAMLAACSCGTTSESSQPAASSASQGTSSVGAATGNRVGDEAPELELPLYDGGSVSLNELRGKPVFLNFFATWCGPCVRELPDIQKIYEDYGDSVHVLCVNSGEDAETVSEFLADKSYSFPIALDVDNVTTKPYSIEAIPQTFVLDSEGVISWHMLGGADYKTFAAALDALLK